MVKLHIGLACSSDAEVANQTAGSVIRCSVGPGYDLSDGIQVVCYMASHL
jgi:hypothetical protein